MYPPPPKVATTLSGSSCAPPIRAGSVLGEGIIMSGSLSAHGLLLAAGDSMGAAHFFCSSSCPAAPFSAPRGVMEFGSWPRVAPMLINFAAISRCP